ncbi:oxidoreductase [Flavimaricola marinus]|uniref:Putative N-methylproline demethylase n=1 Tax=Flavimaricola marinus TaxID=1819565 RepID=A0A238LBD5_9RHOB|nr:FAD-dependent oxidoreductase [Flavimaricola marinus]SMY06873.1 putative N-methylproline demethylase [Flavimaricola marinus]
MSYPHVFQPLTLRHKTLRNRVVFGAHTANMAQGGLPGAQHIGYYRERAMGGAAMIVVEPMPVHPAAVLTRGNFSPETDAVIPAFRAVTEAVQAEGAVILQQLYHVGAHGDQDNAWHPAWSPSGGLSYHDSDGSHAMSEAEIESTIGGFVLAAQRCQQAGFDGVEVWAAYHALPDQFWTPFSNQRTDRWGGSLENRTRFSREILHRIRRACGDDFIVGLAVNDEPDVPAALGREALAEVIALHDAENAMDYVTCGSGSYFDFYKLMPTFLYPEKLTVDLAQTLKGVVQTAKVTSESHIRTPDNAEDILRSGQADLVSIVRGQIADPHLVNKARDDRAEDVRGCISCNQMCWGRRSRDYWISCLVNPSAGREWEWGGDRFEAKGKGTVLVVGGGPAGLEAARAAAERGFAVTLAEAGAALGGQFRLAGLQPRRGQITDLIKWYERQLRQLGVEVRLNTYLEADEIAAHGADHIAVATGSLPDETGFQRAMTHLATLPGLSRGRVWSPEDILTRAARPGPRVIVLDEGGNWRGCGTAWWLAEAGHKVTLVTPDAMIGKELARSAADFPLRKRLAGLGVAFVTESGIAEWLGNGGGADVVCLLTGEVTRIGADDLVLATTNRSVSGLQGDLADLGIGATLLGDAAAPRMAALAVHDGRKWALGLT